MPTTKANIIAAFESCADADGIVSLKGVYEWFRKNRPEKEMTERYEKAIQREIQAFCSDRKYFQGGDDLFEAVDRGKYRLRQAARARPEDFEPTADPDELALRVRRICGRVMTQPPGVRHPEKGPVGDREAYKRCPKVVDWVLGLAEGKCELCGAPAPFEDEHGDPFLEVHHVKWLREGGSDTVDNAAGLCPNCHRRLHHGDTRAMDKTRLYELVARLVVE